MSARMPRYSVSAAMMTALIVACGNLPAVGGTFDIKDPEITKGETEVATNHTLNSGFPAKADPVRHSFEFTAGYAFTESFKAGAKVGYDTHVGDNPRHTIAGVEGQYFVGKVAPAVTLAWFTGLDFRIHHGETNTLVFGPLVKIGNDSLSLTLNPLLEHTFGANRDDGLGITYAVGLKAAARQGLAVGIEAHGSITDVANPPGGHVHEHRIGPVLYFDRELSPATEGRNARKLSLEIGTFLGLTEATPDLSGKFKAALTW
jgi:hypothetical protein